MSVGDKELLDWLNYYGKKSIVVLTKTDKLSRQKSISRAKRIGNQLKEITSEKPTLFSAKTREGREETWEKINQAINI